MCGGVARPAPGYDPIWLGSGLIRLGFEHHVVNPLAIAAESSYTYLFGDSLAIQLPRGRRVMVRELRVRPRATRWDLLVGSLWIDGATGDVVRAVYRLAAPMRIEDARLVVAGDDGRPPGFASSRRSRHR